MPSATAPQKGAGLKEWCRSPDGRPDRDLMDVEAARCAHARAGADVFAGGPDRAAAVPLSSVEGAAA